MGFLGLTADVTGFELDSDVLLASLFLGICVQLLKDAAPTDDKRGKDITKQRQFSK